MADATGLEFRAQARVHRRGLVVGIVVAVGHREVAQSVNAQPGGREILLVGVVGVAHATVHGGAVVDVVFQARHHGAHVVREVGAGVDAGAGVWRSRHLRDTRAEGRLGAELPGFAFGGEGVQRPAQAAAGVVHAKGCHVGTLAATVDIAFAVAHQRIGAHAPLVVFTEAAAHVQVGAELGLAHVAGGQARQRRVGRTLGHQVDAAADAAARAHAVGQGARALEHFHALDHFQRDAGRGAQAEQAVQAHVGVGHREATHLEVIAIAAARLQGAHGCIVHHHVGHRQRLLVLDQLVGVVGGAEGHVHLVGAAQDAQVTTARKLTAVVSLLQTTDGFGLLAHLHFIQRGAGGAGLRRHTHRGHGQARAQALAHQQGQGMGGEATGRTGGRGWHGVGRDREIQKDERKPSRGRAISGSRTTEALRGAVASI